MEFLNILNAKHLYQEQIEMQNLNKHSEKINTNALCIVFRVDKIFFEPLIGFSNSAGKKTKTR